MKRICLLALAAFLSATVSGQLKKLDITGKWIDKELQVEYNFSDNNTACFTQMGYGIPISYNVDFSKSPYWIDFTILRAGARVKMPGLLRVINKDTIWIEQFQPLATHPTKFSKDFTSRTRKIHVLVRMKS